MQIVNFRSILLRKMNKHVILKLCQESIIFNGTTLSIFVCPIEGFVKHTL
jgi:hypothetical protein